MTVRLTAEINLWPNKAIVLFALKVSNMCVYLWLLYFNQSGANSSLALSDNPLRVASLDLLTQCRPHSCIKWPYFY